MKNIAFPKESSRLVFTTPVMYYDYIEVTILLTNYHNFKQVGSFRYNKDQTISSYWCNDKLDDYRYRSSESVTYIHGLLTDYMSVKEDVPPTIIQFVSDKLEKILSMPVSDEDDDIIYDYDLHTFKIVVNIFASLLGVWAKEELKRDGGKN